MHIVFFGTKLKTEREIRGWSQEYLAEKIHVSCQSISKWETNKNYPSIEIIVDLSDLFDITLDELLKSDEGLKDKVIKDSQQWVGLSRGAYVLIGIGMLVGIIIVSILKNGELNMINLTKPLGITALLLFAVLFLRIGAKRVYESER